MKRTLLCLTICLAVPLSGTWPHGGELAAQRSAQIR